MSEQEFLVISWVLALSTGVAVASWLIIVMQAFFHDKRIGFACAFGGAIAALAMGLSERLSHTLLWLLLAANLLLIGWFAIRHFRKPFVYIPLTSLLISATGVAWVWWRLQQAGFFNTN